MPTSTSSDFDGFRPPTLSKLLHAAGILAGSVKGSVSVKAAQPGREAQLADLLEARLASARAVLTEEWLQSNGLETQAGASSEDAVKLATAKFALGLLLALQNAEENENVQSASTSTSRDAPPAPVFGSRDIKTIQTLASLIARWGLAMLVETGILPAEMQDKPANIRAKIAEIDEEGERFEAQNLATLTKGCTALLVPIPPVRARELQATVLPLLIVPCLAALLQLGQSDSSQNADASLQKLLALVNPSTAMASLFTLLGGSKQSPTRPAWLPDRVASALSVQLVRPGGILGLLNVLLGRSGSELQVTQLEQVARLLMSPPTGSTAEDYLAIVLPRILALLKPSDSTVQAPPPSYVKALCFCLSRAIVLHPESVRRHILPAFFFEADDIENQLDLLGTILANIDPAPSNYAFLLNGVLDRLFSMWLFLKETKADPVLRGVAEKLLSIWCRTLSEVEVSQGLSRAVNHVPAYHWQRTAEGGIAADPEGRQTSSTADIMLIKPDPALVVQWLQKMERPQVISLLLVQWLDEIRTLQNEPEHKADFQVQKAIILRLQLVLKIIEECGSEIVKEAKQTLVFIDHALDTGPVSPAVKVPVKPRQSGSKSTISLNDLKIVDSDSEASDEEETGEDASEFPELQGIAKGEELVVTGLTLLLAVLEGNEGLSHANTPILHSISARLDQLSDSENPTTSRLARDANMILALRKAAQSSETMSVSAGPLGKSRETYQEALKLLQDPILPIRAQGLAMLRSLVASKDALFSTDPALIPAVLDIFVQAVQDDDSFLYLNAVQGLSVMVDSFGKDIAVRLVRLYLGNNPVSVGEGEKGRRELDKRLRVGEALVQIAQRAAQALPIYASTLVPPLLHIIRTATLPVAMRSSAFTVLAVIAEASPASLRDQQAMLVDACLDLLSLESRSIRATKEADETPEPLEEASTHPSLRRGGLVCIGHLLRANPEGFDRRTLTRMVAVLGYLKATDEDPLARHNAGEVLVDCETLLS